MRTLLLQQSNGPIVGQLNGVGPALLELELKRLSTPTAAVASASVSSRRTGAGRSKQD